MIVNPFLSPPKRLAAKNDWINRAMEDYVIEWTCSGKHEPFWRHAKSPNPYQCGRSTILALHLLYIPHKELYTECRYYQSIVNAVAKYETYFTPCSPCIEWAWGPLYGWPSFSGSRAISPMLQGVMCALTHGIPRCDIVGSLLYMRDLGGFAFRFSFSLNRIDLYLKNARVGAALNSVACGDMCEWSKPTALSSDPWRMGGRDGVFHSTTKVIGIGHVALMW